MSATMSICDIESSPNRSYAEGSLPGLSGLVDAMDRLCSAGDYTVGENAEVGFTAVGVKDPRVALFYKLVRNVTPETFRELFDAVASVPAMLEDLFVLAFQTRDVRGGKGEKALFLRFILDLYQVNPRLTLTLVPLVPEYGSWLDVVKIIESTENTKELRDACFDLYCAQLEKDRESENPSLAGKWAPRENRSKSHVAKEFALRLFPGSDSPRKLYRQMVAKINRKLDTTEIKMAGDEWDTIDPASVPSNCLTKNRMAFLNKRKLRNGVMKVRSESAKRIKCAETFTKHALEALKGGKKMNGKTLHPHQIVREYMKYGCEENPILEAQWMNLKSTLCGSSDTSSYVIPLVDVSGSMRGEAMEVAIALGLMLSEVTHPIFRDRVLTFETVPRWFGLSESASVHEKVKKLQEAPWGGSTDFAKAMDLILKACIENSVPAADVKSMTLVVFSDMQFDVAEGTGGYYYSKSVAKTEKWATAYEKLSERFHGHGYDVPHMVFWNLRGDTDDFPAAATTPGVSMLSGFSSAMLKPFLNGDIQELRNKETEAGMEPENRPDAYDSMRVILDDDRYLPVRRAVRSFLAGCPTSNRR